MNNNQKARDLMNKAYELRGNKAKFLLEHAKPIREKISKINSDPMLSPEGKSSKIRELKEKETREFMKKISLRKQEYQYNLSKAKDLALAVIDKSFIVVDDATKARFNRELAELKFKIGLLNDEQAVKKIDEYVKGIKDPEYAQLFLDNFYEISSRFNNAKAEQKQDISKVFAKLKENTTPAEVLEAHQIIEEVEQTINGKMFSANKAESPEYSIISEVFTEDAANYYQEPEKYYELKRKVDDTIVIPVYKPEKIVEETAKSKIDQVYDNTSRIMAEKLASGELKL